MKKLLLLALLAGCASTAPAPQDHPAHVAIADVLEVDGEVGTIDGRPVRVDLEGGARYRSQDGVHFVAIGSQDLLAPDGLDLERTGERWRITREYDSERPEGPASRYLLWRQDGLSWKHVATLPAPERTWY